MTELATRRNEIESELTTLRQQRGKATLDGQKFPYVRKISALTDELEALNEAEGEAARREREKAELEYQKNLAAMRKELAVAEAQYLGCVQEANQAARNLAAALGGAMDASRSISKLVPVISKEPVAAVITPNEVASRLSGRLSAVMSSIPGRHVRFGGIEWRGASRFIHADDWRQMECAVAEPHLKPLINEGKKTNA